MNTNSLAIWLLVTYLAALLSCGDALHQLSHLRHHHGSVRCEKSESGAADSAVAGHTHKRRCCCQHFEAPLANRDAEIAAEISDSDAQDDEHCLICDFFDEYQASVCQIDFCGFHLPCFNRYCWEVGDAKLVLVPKTARGPPLV